MRLVLLLLVVALASAGCSNPTHYDFAAKLKQKGIDGELKTDNERLATFTERKTGQKLVVAIATSDAAARKQYENMDFAPKHGGAFVSGRYVVAAPRDEDGDLLTRAQAALK